MDTDVSDSSDSQGYDRRSQSFGLELNRFHRLFSNTGAVAGTFAAVGVATGLVLLMILLCCKRYRRKNKRRARMRALPISQPQMRGRTSTYDDPFAYSNPRHSAATGRPSLITTDEQAMGYAENGSSTHGFNTQRNDGGNNVLHEAGTPHLAGVDPGATVNHRDQNPNNPFADPHTHPSTLRQGFTGGGPTTVNHLAPITPTPAYLPVPDWKRVSEAPSSPSVYPASLVIEDDESDHQMATPMSAAFPRTTASPNRNYNWGASANKPNSYKVNPGAYMTPPDTDDEYRYSVFVEDEGPPQSVPPPIPPKNPLRPAAPARTLLTVSSLSRSPFVVRTHVDDSIAVVGPREGDGMKPILNTIDII